MLFPSPAYFFPQPLLQDPSREIPRCHDSPARSRIPGEITHPRHVFSRGHIFRKRRDKIRWLKKLLSILDGRKP